MDDLLRADLSSLTLADLAGALADAGDEDTRWECKGHQGPVRAEHVYRAVAGFYNREGGLLVLGATPSDQGWELDGMVFPELEVELWLSNVVRDNLRPAPECQYRAFATSDGRSIALVRVPAGHSHLTITGSGVVYRREHGSTVALNDGARLTELLLRRLPPPQPAEPSTPSAAMDRDALRSAVRAAISRDKTSSLLPLHPQLRAAAVRAAQNHDRDALDAALDKHVELTALLLHDEPEHPVTRASLQSWHSLFDEGRTLRAGPSSPDSDLWLALRVRILSLCALCRRFELWSQLRLLTDHAIDGGIGTLWASWLTSVDAEAARAIGSGADAETYRQPLRAAATLALRLPALNPDGLDEEGLLASVVAGEFLSRLVEIESADRGGRSKETYPACAHFDLRPLHSLAAQLADGGPITRDLTPVRVQADVLRLMADLDVRCRASVGQRGFWHGFADPETEQRMRRFARPAT